MRGLKYIWLYLLLSATTVLFATVLFQPLLAASPQNSGASSTSQQPERDGQRDFDFELGTWKTTSS